MRHKISLLIRQAEMKSRMKTKKRKLHQAVPRDRLRRRIAATMLVVQKGYGARELAIHFGWEEKDVELWLRAGRALW